MAKAKKSEKDTSAVTEANTESTATNTAEEVEAVQSAADLLEKMKKEGKSYIRIKKLF
jgi:hypothetical protein